MLEELLEHIDDSSARRHSLPGAPSVDFLDQLGLDPDVDICCFLSHAGEMGRCGAHRLIIPAKRLIDATGGFAEGLTVAISPLRFGFRDQAPARPALRARSAKPRVSRARPGAGRPRFQGRWPGMRRPRRSLEPPAPLPPCRATHCLPAGRREISLGPSDPLTLHRRFHRSDPHSFI
jgi:hypothetical protein